MLAESNTSNVGITLNNFINIQDSYKTKCDVTIMYTGVNYYGERYTLEAIHKALPTLKNTPIVGVFSFVTKDFNDHVPRVEINGYSTHETIVYGHVPESAEVVLQDKEIIKHDGTQAIVQEVTVKNCILHTGIYGELKELIDNSKSQSMEVVWLDTKHNEEGIIDVLDFKFKALCILGDNITPVYENGNVSVVKELTYSSKEADVKRTIEKVEKYIKEMNLEDNKEFTDKIYSIYESNKEENNLKEFLEKIIAKYKIDDENLEEFNKIVTLKDEKLFINGNEIDEDKYEEEVTMVIESIVNQEDEEVKSEEIDGENKETVQDVLQEFNVTKEELETIVNVDEVGVSNLKLILKTLNIEAVKENYNKKGAEENSKLILIGELDNDKQSELVKMLLDIIETLNSNVEEVDKSYSLQNDLQVLDNITYNKAYEVIDVLDTLAFNHVLYESPKLVKATLEELESKIKGLVNAYQLAVNNSKEIQALLDENTKKLNEFEYEANKTAIDNLLEEFNFNKDDFKEDIYSMKVGEVETLCYVTIGKKEYSKRDEVKKYSTSIPVSNRFTEKDMEENIDKLIDEIKKFK